MARDAYAAQDRQVLRLSDALIEAAQAGSAIDERIARAYVAAVQRAHAAGVPLAQMEIAMNPIARRAGVHAVTAAGRLADLVQTAGSISGVDAPLPQLAARLRCADRDG